VSILVIRDGYKKEATLILKTLTLARGEIRAKREKKKISHPTSHIQTVAVMAVAAPGGQSGCEAGG